MREAPGVESPPRPATGSGPSPRNDLPLVVCSSPISTRQWRWFEDRYHGLVRWDFYYGGPPRANGPRLLRRLPNIDLARSCFQAARAAKGGGARLLITHDPRATVRAALAQRLIGDRTPHVAWSFNFPKLPRGATRRAMTRAFRGVDRFIVFSTLESTLYQEYFGIPGSKIDMVYWGVGDPPVSQPDTPIEPGDYICAVGGNARDYPTLMAAMERLPDVSLAIVVRPHNLVGLTIPPNVRVHVNRPNGDTNNIIKFSRFMALPLAGSDVPCGHVTLVNAMLQSKAMVITNSSGVRDYVHEDVNALTCEANSPEALAARIRELWDDPERSARLGAGGRRFAEAHCTEASSKAQLDRVLREYGVLEG